MKKKKSLIELRREIDKKDINIRDFTQAIYRKPNTPIHLIAEVKKASPSQGIIRGEFQPVQIAKIYSMEGADAISVLTDINFFQGDLSYLNQIRSEVPLPLLRKDFIIDEYQILESVHAGADAILLIVAALDRDLLSRFYRIATRELGLSVLVEIHTPDELKQALDIGAEIIGINNRNLQSFEVKLSTTEEIRSLIPQNHIIVSESGIKNRRDVEYLSGLNIDALLIAETFMRSPNISSKIRELFP